ncbi:MAG: filamentous hemagglutinin N-terminal domain-containing protein, partial [Prochlorotrichaceae cyanobacterium]
MFFSDCFWRHIPHWSVAVVLILGSSASQIQAQPVPSSADNTGTIVTLDNDRFDISGGSLSVDGENLFHSFEQFGLSQGQVANFLANPNIRNILSRVMGGDASVIDGLLQVTGGTPNLYLMNPAGIIFGSGARLDLPASFTATTATGIDFNQKVFSAFQENDYSVLVNDPTSLIFAIVEPGAIVNAGVLSVPDFANLNLIGGQVLNLGTLTGGDVTVTALPGQSTLRVTPEGRILSLDLSLPEGIALENLTPAKLPQLLLGTDLEQATDLAVQEDGSVWLVAPDPQNSAAIVGAEVNILAEKAIAGNGLIEGDRLALRAETLGTKDQPLFTQVNALSTDTALSNGDQFLVNLQGLTSLNLNAGTEGFLSLTVQGAILDADPDLDVQAATLKLDTLGGIGTIDSPLQTAVQTIAAQASQTGGIAIQNQNNLNVATVDQLAGIQTQSGTIALQVREGNLTLNSSENPLQPILQTVDSGDLILEAAQINLYSPVQSAGAQTYQGNLVLGTDVQLKSTQQGAIVFQGTIDSDQSATPRNLSVETGGVTQFNGPIGSISPLATLETDAQGGVTEQTIFNTNLIQTIANQRFQDPVQLVQT